MSCDQVTWPRHVIFFGFFNDLTLFEYYINNIFLEYFNIFYMVYLNKILIYSNSLYKYKKYVKRILKYLKSVGLLLNIIKYKFYIIKFLYLRCIINIYDIKIIEKLFLLDQGILNNFILPIL